MPEKEMQTILRLHYLFPAPFMNVNHWREWLSYSEVIDQWMFLHVLLTEESWNINFGVLQFVVTSGREQRRTQPSLQHFRSEVQSWSAEHSDSLDLEKFCSHQFEEENFQFWQIPIRFFGEFLERIQKTGCIYANCANYQKYFPK